MKLGLFKRLSRTYSRAVLVRRHHDPLAHRQIEFKHLHKRLYHVFHGIHVIIVEQDFVPRDERSMTFRYRSGFG